MSVSDWPLTSRLSVQRVASWALALAAVALSADIAIRLTERTGGKLVLLALIPVAVAALYMLLTRTDWLLLAVLVSRAALDPLFVLMKTGSDGGLTPGAVVNAVVLLSFVLLAVIRPRRLLRGYVLIWVPFIALVLLAHRNAPDPAKATRMLLQYLSYLAMFCSASMLIDRRRDARRWLLALLAASLVPTVYGFLDLAGAIEHPPDPMQDETEDLPSLLDDGQFRVQGAFTHANIYAFFLITTMMALLYTLKSGLFNLGPLTRTLGYGYMAVQLGMLVATQTRSAWVVCGFLFLAYGLFLERRVLVYTAVAPVLGYIFVPEVRDRVNDLFVSSAANVDGQLNSFAWRVQMWKAASVWIEEKWLVGWGLDSYTEYSSIFFPLEYLKAFDAHNVFVQFAFELGVPGAIAFTLIFLVLAMIAASRLHARRFEALLLLVGSVGYLMECYSDNMHRYLVSNWYTFFFLGLMCAIVTMPVAVRERARHRRRGRSRAAADIEAPRRAA